MQRAREPDAYLRRRKNANYFLIRRRNSLISATSLAGSEPASALLKCAANVLVATNLVNSTTPAIIRRTSISGGRALFTQQRVPRTLQRLFETQHSRD